MEKVMEALSEQEFRERAEQAFRSIFISDDPFGKPFNPHIEYKLLLFDYRWALSDPWIEPIGKAIRDMGEDGFYVTALYRPKGDAQSRPYHWYVPINEIDQYGSLIHSQQNAIYSCLGKWGIICSDEDHALVGGPRILIEMIQKSVIDIDKRVQEFIKLWLYYHDQNQVRIDWLPGLLAHIYGNDDARRLLGEAGWDQPTNLL